MPTHSVQLYTSIWEGAGAGGNEGPDGPGWLRLMHGQDACVSALERFQSSHSPQSANTEQPT